VWELNSKKQSEKAKENEMKAVKEEMEETKRKSQHMIDGFFRQVTSQSDQLQWYEVENKYLRAKVENLRARLQDGEFTVHFVNSLVSLVRG
jgi:anti-sigma28 factor (negative regulator of flagellin synthesis)